MKKILVLLLILSACKTHQPLPRLTLFYSYDFRSYSEEGFFISPNPYQGKYIPVGMVSVDIFPGERVETVLEHDLIANSEEKVAKFIKEKISAQECLVEIVNQAKKMGANGLANFEAYVIYRCNYSGIISERDVIKYELSGFAIKVLDVPEKNSLFKLAD